jgi:transcriptional regulator with XRE-family HTH domain
MPSMGEKIRAARIQRGLTQTDLSSDLVTPSMISQIESDKARPSYTLLCSIANRLGMPVEYFLDDFDDLNNHSTYMKLAEYYVRRHQPEEAELVLRAVPTPDNPGLARQQFMFLHAQIHRLKGQYMDAIRILEELREQALRNQDYWTQFQVCKESGHIEYALDNLAGAMHEWKSALLLGDRLISVESLTTAERNHHLAEVCTLLYRLHVRQNDLTTARAYLEQADQFCRGMGRFRDIAESLAKDCETALSQGEAVKAKHSIEFALSILHVANWVEQHIWVQASFPTEASDKIDPWTQAAFATASVNPYGLIDVELSQIERALEREDITVAERRLNRFLDLFEDYRAEGILDLSVEQSVDTRLTIAQARIKRLSGEREEAYQMLETLLNQLKEKGEDKQRIQVLAWLLRWRSKDGFHEQVLQVTAQLQSLVDKVYAKPFQL